MAYSATIRMGQRESMSNKYRRSGQGGLIKGMFVALFRFIGVSMLLGLSLGFILIISIAILYGYNKAMNSDFFILKDIEISGNSQLTYSVITKLMGVNSGENVLQLRMSELHSKLNSNPWIESVSLKRQFPDKLIVNINERQAYFWIQDENRLSYADERGRVITDIAPGRYVSLPVLFIEGESRSADLQALVGLIENRSFPFSLQDISWIRLKNSGSLEMRIDSYELNITLDSSALRSGPGRLNLVWSDLRSRGDTDKVRKIIVAGRNAWVEFKDT
ncbi:MAG: FtsQ-type POTRA domain-containing protein [Desulfonatronovibrio sp. MSAO_Bac4]|nr:MAG: FtsQ-type POTRA domain-containing protein [Desulfonatronovibrio sp. MSAO_Bac4]